MQISSNKSSRWRNSKQKKSGWEILHRQRSAPFAQNRTRFSPQFFREQEKSLHNVLGLDHVQSTEPGLRGKTKKARETN
jgi:hypothetical protein